MFNSYLHSKAKQVSLAQQVHTELQSFPPQNCFPCILFQLRGLKTLESSQSILLKCQTSHLPANWVGSFFDSLLPYPLPTPLMKPSPHTVSSGFLLYPLLPASTLCPYCPVSTQHLSGFLFITESTRPSFHSDKKSRSHMMSFSTTLPLVHFSSHPRPPIVP